jgi:hypothetical protein
LTCFKLGLHEQAESLIQAAIKILKEKRD